MGHKTRAILALTTTALFLVPSAASEAPYSRSYTSHDCGVGIFFYVPSPIPCSVTLDMTLTGRGCEGNWCTYTLNVTSTGRSSLPGWLQSFAFFYPGDGFYVSACGPYPTQELIGDLHLLPCENMACNYATFGTEVACSASLEITQYVAIGECGILFLGAELSADVRGVGTGEYVGVCHMADGSVDFRQWATH